MRISLSKHDSTGEVTVKVSESDDLEEELSTSHTFPFEKVRDEENVTVEVFHEKKGKTSGQLLRKYGKKLFNALFKEDTPSWKLLQEIMTLHSDGPILLELNKHQDLDDIAWEYTWAGHDYLVRQCIFTRIHKRPGPQFKGLPLRIVVVAPDPLDSHTWGMADLHLGDQFQNFIDEYQRNLRNVILERVMPATVQTMNSLLADKQAETATVLHFMGHCVTSENGSRSLVFEHRDTGNSEHVDTLRLIGDSKLRLAFLSACNTREVARTMVQHGVQYTIGSFCDLPDDIARKFEAHFYQYLAQGQSVAKAILRTRKELADLKDHRQRDYLPGSMILYSTTSWESNDMFLCGTGAPTVDIYTPHNNLDVKISTIPNICGRKNDLASLNLILRRMVSRTRQFRSVCTITGISGQGKTTLAKKAVKKTLHCFPGGTFAWQFQDDAPISATSYLRELVNTLLLDEVDNFFPNGITPTNCDVHVLGWAIFKKIQGTCLLILDHADTLKRAQGRGDNEAVSLWKLFAEVSARQGTTVKFLVTSHEPLGWNLVEAEVQLQSFRSDIKSGYDVFLQNLDVATKERIEKEVKTMEEKMEEKNRREAEVKAIGGEDAAKLEKEAERMKEEAKKIEDEVKRMQDEVIRMQGKAKRMREEAQRKEGEAKRMKESAKEMKEAKRVKEVEEDPERLLHDLVTCVDGHPLCLKLLAQAASTTKNRDKSLKVIAGGYYHTLLEQPHAMNTLNRRLKTMIDALPTQQRLLLYMCSLFIRPVKKVEINEISKLFGQGVSTGPDIDKGLQHLCHLGLLLKEGEEHYRNHIAVCKVAKQLDTEFKLQKNKADLHHAAAEGYVEIVRLFVTMLRADANSKEDIGETPLHRAAENGHVKVVGLLVSELKANVNAKDDTGKTPLHWAAASEHVEVVRLLVSELKADANAIDCTGGTPLHRAAECGHVEIVRLFLSKFGAKVDAGDNDKRTPLHHSAINGHVDVVSLLMGEFKADANVMDSESRTPLRCALMFGHVEVVRLLVGEFKADANANANDNDGRTPLHLAAVHGKVEIVRLFLAEFKADPNAKDNNGRTPLHWAATAGCVEIVKLLVADFQADTNATDYHGETALDLAKIKEKNEVVKYLQELGCK